MKKGSFLLTILLLLTLSGCMPENIDTQKPIMGHNILGEFDTFAYVFDLGGPVPNWLEGVDAFDFTDGYLTDQIVVDASNVNMAAIGEYKIIYTVSDKAGNTTIKEVPVYIKDLTSPYIIGFSEQTIGINYANKSSLFNQVVARDEQDGDLTNDLIIDDSIVDYEKPGVYPISYQVADDSGNSIHAKAKLTILEEDGTKDKPIQIGSRYTVTANSPLYGDYTIEVMVNSVTKGKEAVALGGDKHTFITNLTAKLVSIDESNGNYIQNGFTIWDDMQINSYLGFVYDPIIHDSITNQINDCSLQIGVSCTGNLVYQVEERDQYYLNIADTYFKLSDDQYVSIGSMINIAKSDIDSMEYVLLGNPVFNPSLFSEYPIHNNRGGSMSESSVHKARKYNEISDTTINEDLEKNALFMDEFGDEYFQYKYQFYYYLESTFSTSFSYIRNYYTTQSTFQSHLTSDFLNDLDLINKNQLSYEALFDRYGTHFITKATYGVKRNAFCSILDNKDLGHNVDCEEASIGIPQLGGNSISVSRSSNITLLEVTTLGGSSYMTNGRTDSEANNNWMDELNADEFHETSVLIELNLDDYGNLVPIWDLLPPAYDNLKSSMEAAYEIYYTNNQH